MEHWQKCVINYQQKIIEAVKKIDSTGAKIALATDEEGYLKGTITDYDIRQAILKKHDLGDSIETVMNYNPKIAAQDMTKKKRLLFMRKNNIHQLPLVDEAGKLVGLDLLEELDQTINEYTDIPIVVMAGGLGSRLRPLTDSCPKPLLKIGDKAILEIILDNFIKDGFKNFYFSVNYKAEMVKEYFGDGSKYGVSIKYLQEDKRLGTAGALSLLPKDIKSPVLIMNGDLLTKVDFRQLISFHMKQKAAATMCIRAYKYQIPYGVVKFKNWQIEKLEEKPLCTSFVNAGIYMVNPEVFGEIKSEYLDMTDLFSEQIEKKQKVLVFPIREYWLDVGRREDFEKAQEEFIW